MTDYRYSLSRRGWLGDGSICWVMLNPSTADHTVDDPTIRRVTRFSRDAGAAELTVVNLFAARATNPTDLLEIDDPVGPEWYDHVDAALARASRIVFAWGAASPVRKRKLGPLIAEQRRRVGEMVAGLGMRPVCLGTTEDGSPRHPLYVAATQPLVPFGAPS